MVLNQASVNDLSGGHCNDTSKNVHMKIEVYVCNKTGGKIPRFSPYPNYFHFNCIMVSIQGVVSQVNIGKVTGYELTKTVNQHASLSTLGVWCGVL